MNAFQEFAQKYTTETVIPSVTQLVTPTSPLVNFARQICQDEQIKKAFEVYQNNDINPVLIIDIATTVYYCIHDRGVAKSELDVRLAELDKLLDAHLKWDIEKPLVYAVINGGPRDYYPALFNVITDAVSLTLLGDYGIQRLIQQLRASRPNENINEIYKRVVKIQESLLQQSTFCTKTAETLATPLMAYSRGFINGVRWRTE